MLRNPLIWLEEGASRAQKNTLLFKEKGVTRAEGKVYFRGMPVGRDNRFRAAVR